MWWVDIIGVTEEAVMTVASLVCVGGGETVGIFFQIPFDTFHLQFVTRRCTFQNGDM